MIITNHTAYHHNHQENNHTDRVLPRKGWETFSKLTISDDHHQPTPACLSLVGLITKIIKKIIMFSLEKDGGPVLRELLTWFDCLDTTWQSIYMELVGDGDVCWLDNHDDILTTLPKGSCDRQGNKQEPGMPNKRRGWNEKNDGCG